MNELINLKPIRPPDLRRGRAPLVVLQLEELQARRLVEVAVVDVVVRGVDPHLVRDELLRRRRRGRRLDDGRGRAAALLPRRRDRLRVDPGLVEARRLLGGRRRRLVLGLLREGDPIETCVEINQ